MGNDSESDSGFSMGDIPEDFGASDSAVNQSDELPVIPGYDLETSLGSGGMGTVYRARWTSQNGQSVAIKTLQHKRFQTLSQSTLRRFRREVELLKSISHENIVPILDAGEYQRDFQSVPYFTMPLMTGGDLSDSLNAAPIESKDDLGREVGKLIKMIGGLAEAHGKGIVHRDIKPRNIFTDASGNYVLGDFGLAKEFEDDSELTSTIGHMGTTPYAPPEQLLSAKTADHRADVYAVGVILYQFACFGLRPFSPDQDSNDDSLSETSSIANWQRSTDRAAPVPSHRTRHLSDPSFDFIVRKSLSYFPEHRYQSLKKLSQDLSSWRRGDSVKGNLGERVRYGLLEPVRPHLKLIGTLAVLFGLIFCAAAYQYVSKLSEGADESRREMAASEQKRRAELREQLVEIVPRLPGEPRYYETKRFVDSLGEKDRLWSRASRLCRELDLGNSEDFQDRHLNWTVMRCGPQGESKDAKLQFRQRICARAIDNHRYASGPFELEESISDICRGYRILFEFFWLTADETAAGEATSLTAYKEIESRFKAEVGRLQADAKTDAARRILKLAELEVAVRDPEITDFERLNRCEAAESELTPAQLSKDGCKRLQTWYLPWYIYQTYAETSRKLEQPLEETKRIFELWMANQEATPHQSKLQNLIYLIDKRFVLDLQADVSRQISPSDARTTYEALWRNGQRLLSFYRSSTQSWSNCEQILSSLINLASEIGDDELEAEYHELASEFYHDWLMQIEATPDMFSDEVVLDVRYEFAFQIASLLTLGSDISVRTLSEANEQIQSVLSTDETYRRAPSLASYLKSEVATRSSH
ncbi:MAG: serine/threonine-protein kinase [Planctomycetota bacterium]